MRSTRENPQDFFRAWQAVEPFRVVVPVDTHPTSAALFISNVSFALEVLRSNLKLPAGSLSRIATAVTRPTISASAL